MFVLHTCLKQRSLGQSLLPCLHCCLSHRRWLFFDSPNVCLSDFKVLRCIIHPHLAVAYIQLHGMVKKFPSVHSASVFPLKMKKQSLIAESPPWEWWILPLFKAFDITVYWDMSGWKRVSPSVTSVRDIFVPCLQQYLQVYWDLPPRRSLVVLVTQLPMMEEWVVFGLFCGGEEGWVWGLINSNSLSKQNYISCLLSLPPGFCN